MTVQEEAEMHQLAQQLEQLTRGTGWPAMRYFQIGSVMNRLAEYCQPRANITSITRDLEAARVNALSSKRPHLAAAALHVIEAIHEYRRQGGE